MTPNLMLPADYLDAPVRYVGLDLGQLQDYTALVVVEQTWQSRLTRQNDATIIGGYNEYEPLEDYQVGYIWRPERGTSYARIVEATRKLLDRPIMQERCAALVVDATGVGRPVVEMFRDAGLAVPVIAISITGGANASYVARDEFHVPKRDLAGELATLFQTPASDDDLLTHRARLRFAKKLPLERVVRAELLNFKAKITPAGNDTYEAGPAGDWREGEHDDVVLALALPIWYARRGVALGGWVAAGAPFLGGMRRKGM